MAASSLPPPASNTSQSLPKPIRQLGLSELRQVVHALLAEVDATQVDVLRGCLGDALHDNGGVRLQNDAVIYDLVDSERYEVVALDYRSSVYRLPIFPSLLSPDAFLPYGWRKTDAYLKRRWRESRRESITLYSKISFSSTPPTTYIMTSDSILYSTIRLSSVLEHIHSQF